MEIMVYRAWNIVYNDRSKLRSVWKFGFTVLKKIIILNLRSRYTSTKYSLKAEIGMETDIHKNKQDPINN